MCRHCSYIWENAGHIYTVAGIKNGAAFAPPSRDYRTRRPIEYSSRSKQKNRERDKRLDRKVPRQ